MIHALVMAGGSGTRFWPRSRKSLPKQFLDVGGETLIQKSVRRLEGLVDWERIWVITGAAHVDLVREQIPEIRPEHVIGEPVGRDTAPCVALGAMLIEREDSDATIVTSPADHLVEPTSVFQDALRAAVNACQDGSLQTLGITPRFPSTQFGYIESAEDLGKIAGHEVYKVAGFREKPCFEKAKTYVESGRFYWNGGIFIWRAQTILDNLRRHAQGLYDDMAALEDVPLAEIEAALEPVYPKLKKISIDYAVMEHAESIKDVPAPFNWDDVGSWLAAERLFGSEENGNTIDGLCHVLDAKDNIVLSAENHLVAAFGVSNLVIVHTPDATLVTTREKAADLKSLIENLKQEGYEKFL